MTTKAELRANYSWQDTEVLLELRSRDTLIPNAYEVLDEILIERGLDPTIAVKSFQEAEKEVTEKQRKDLPSIEEYWRGLYLSFTVYACAFVISMIGAGTGAGAGNNPGTVLAGVVAFCAMLPFYVFLGKLASALGKNAPKWIVIALLIPFGKIVALACMQSQVSNARTPLSTNLSSQADVAEPGRADRQMEEKLPKGLCPNCRETIPLSSTECKHCRAMFGSQAAWRVPPQSEA